MGLMLPLLELAPPLELTHVDVSPKNVVFTYLAYLSQETLLTWRIPLPWSPPQALLNFLGIAMEANSLCKTCVDTLAQPRMKFFSLNIY